MKYNLKVFGFFLKRNSGMLLLIIAAFVFSFFGYNTPYDISEKTIVGGIQAEHDYIYVYEDIESDEIIYKTITKDDLGSSTIKDNKIYTNVLSGLAIGMWILFVISVIAIAILTFNDIWAIKQCRYDAMNSFVYCELEDDTYYYFIEGKLIYQKKDQFRIDYNIAEHVGLYKLSQLNKFPKFQTRMQKRDNILNNIGVS